MGGAVAGGASDEERADLADRAAVTEIDGRLRHRGLCGAALEVAAVAGQEVGLEVAEGGGVTLAVGPAVDLAASGPCSARVEGPRFRGTHHTQACTQWFEKSPSN